MPERFLPDTQDIIHAAAKRYFEIKVVLDGDAEPDLRDRVPVELRPAVRILFGHQLIAHAQRLNADDSSEDDGSERIASNTAFMPLS